MDAQIGLQTYVYKQKNKESARQAERQTDSQTNRMTDGQPDKQKDRRVKRQKDGRTDGRTNGQTVIGSRCFLLVVVREIDWVERRKVERAASVLSVIFVTNGEGTSKVRLEHGRGHVWVYE